MAGKDQARGGEGRLRFADLACRRGGRLLFAHLALTLEPGECAMVTGANGAGKSSLLRLVAGLLPAYAGSIERTGQLSLADDRPALDDDRSLRSALAFWSGIDGHAGAERAAMAMLDLDALADLPVRMLSTGQRKRAALARTIASGAAIWLLDEPTNGLDAASVERLGEIVRQHRGRGGVVLSASHQPLPWVQTYGLALPLPEGVA